MCYRKYMSGYCIFSLIGGKSSAYALAGEPLSVPVSIFKLLYSRLPFPGGGSGSWVMKVVPSPSFVSTFISPPCAFTIS